MEKSKQLKIIEISTQIINRAKEIELRANQIKWNIASSSRVTSQGYVLLYEFGKLEDDVNELKQIIELETIIKNTEEIKK